MIIQFLEFNLFQTVISDTLSGEDEVPLSKRLRRRHDHDEVYKL